MSDRELLELAAKAAYIRVRCSDVGLFSRDDGQYWISWNPLTDDGDALRLAVKLEMQVSVGFRRIDAVIVSDGDEASICASEPKTGDLYAATRRAIVRAAAEIGKAMEDKRK